MLVVVDSNYHIIDGKCHENDKDEADHHGCLIDFGPLMYMRTDIRTFEENS